MKKLNKVALFSVVILALFFIFVGKKKNPSGRRYLP